MGKTDSCSSWTKTEHEMKASLQESSSSCTTRRVLLSTATRLRFECRHGQDILPLLQNIQAGSWVHPASYSMSSSHGVKCGGGGGEGRGAKLMTLLYPAPRLNMSSSIRPMPLYTVTACTGATSPFSFMCLSNLSP